MAAKKRLLVTGISGFLGWHFARFQQDDWDIIGTYNKRSALHSQARTMPLDLNDEVYLQRTIKALRPDAIVHLAAASNPNFCEQNENISYSVNVKSAVHLAQLAAEAKIPFLFTSTDLVFDGQRSPYNEEDITNPVSVYAKHKIMAEDGIKAINPEAIIARLPLLYGFPKNGRGFMNAWINKLKEGESVHAFTDEYRTAVDGFSAVEGLFLLLQKNVSGTWHLGGKERMSRFAFAERIAQHFGMCKDLIVPSLQEEVEMPASRPPDVSLDSSKAFYLGYKPRRVGQVLDALVG